MYSFEPIVINALLCIKNGAMMKMYPLINVSIYKVVDFIMVCNVFTIRTCFARSINHCGATILEEAGCVIERPKTRKKC